MTISICGSHKIVLKGSHTEGGSEHEEGPLTAAAYPGMNVVLAFAEESQQVFSYTPGSTDYVGTGTGVSTVKSPVKILEEDSLQGKTVEDAYASGDRGMIFIPRAGDVLQVRVLSGQDVHMTDGLSANSDGKWVVDAANPSLEALESTAGTLGADALVRARVL